MSCYRTAWGTWFVQIRVNGERYYLGTCETEEEAVELRDSFLEKMNAVRPTADVS